MLRQDWRSWQDTTATRRWVKVNRAEIHDGVAYASVRLESTTRSEPFLEELRQGIRDGISPGFLILAAEFVEEENDVVMLITRWQPFEISSTPIPRMMSASLLRIDGSPSVQLTKPHTRARVPVLTCPLERSAARRTLFLIPAPDARTAEYVGHKTGRARVTEPIPKTAVERATKMSEIETRVDAKLADLSRREMALLGCGGQASDWPGPAVPQGPRVTRGLRIQPVRVHADLPGCRGDGRTAESPDKQGSNRVAGLDVR